MTLTNNLSAVIHKANDLRLENLPIPEINDYEALIHMDCVGICGSDVKMLSTGKCGLAAISDPLTTGHEGSGIVIKVGSKVSGVRVGDRVAIEPTQPCRGCEFCKSGRYNLCPQPYYCSAPPAPGNLTTYYKHVADYLHVIPEHLSMEEGAAVQPLAIAIHACRRAGVSLGDRLLILGSGPIGILALMAAKSMGAATVIMTDVLQSRLDYAKKMGADLTLLVKKEYTDEQVVEKIKQLLGVEPDISIDACGFESATNVAMLATKSGGVALIVGIGAQKSSLPLTQCMMREVDVRGSYRFSNTYPIAISMIANGCIDLKSYISHHFSLEETHRAFEVAAAGEGMKVIVHVQPRDTNNKVKLL